MTDENKNVNNQYNEHSHNPNYGSKVDEEDELEKLKKQSDEYLNGWKRAKADYLNLKKEMESQNKEIKEWMKKIFLLPLLGIMDNFDKAFTIIPESLKTDEWVKGIGAAKKQLEDYFKSQGVEPIAAKGEKFDPIKHEAVDMVEGGLPAQAGEPGMIAEEIQKGYTINGEILRPAKVKVYK